jgi:hypothetical protein
MHSLHFFQNFHSSFDGLNHAPQVLSVHSIAGIVLRCCLEWLLYSVDYWIFIIEILCACDQSLGVGCVHLDDSYWADDISWLALGWSGYCFDGCPEWGCWIQNSMKYIPYWLWCGLFTIQMIGADDVCLWAVWQSGYCYNWIRRFWKHEFDTQIACEVSCGLKFISSCIPG